MKDYWDMDYLLRNFRRYFNHINFFQYCKTNQDELSKVKHYYSDYIRFEILRNTNVPRLLGIPDPFAYYNQCLCLKENWTKIQRYFYKYTNKNDEFLNISRVHIQKNVGKKELFIMNNYESKAEDDCIRAQLLFAKKYKIKADINNFFPSIYTHAISWALVGKKQAKNCKQSKKWFNNIDMYTRSMRNNETTGILIGPHSSNLLSEIILKKIDYELLRKKWRFIRYIDDYECFAPTEARAKIFILELSQELRKFGLTLNARKTDIKELPTTQHFIWYRRLKLYMMLKQDKVWKQIDIANCFDIASEFEAQTHDASVFNYLIKSLSRKKMEDSARKYFVNIVCHLIIIRPYLISLVDPYVFAKNNIDEDRIRAVSTAIYKTGIKTRNYEAVWYAIYFCIKYKLHPSISIDFERVKESHDCIFMLLAYIEAKRLQDQSAIVEHIRWARELMEDESQNPYLGQYWLYIYEVLSEMDISKECWKKMKKSGISFLKDEYRF